MRLTVFLGIIVVWSGFAGGIYCTAMSIIGDKYSGKDLAIANTLFGVIYAFGGVVGPLANGFAIDTLNSHGLMVSASLIFCFFIVFSLFIRFRIN